MSERLQDSNEWLASSYEELDEYDKKIVGYEKQIKNAYIFTTVATNTISLVPVAIGLIEMGNGNTDRGWAYVKTGLVLTIGVNIVYQGGHWIFKIW